MTSSCWIWLSVVRLYSACTLYPACVLLAPHILLRFFSRSAVTFPFQLLYLIYSERITVETFPFIWAFYFCSKNKIRYMFTNLIVSGFLRVSYDPSGHLFVFQICIDGLNIKQYNLPWYRSQIGLVSQEATLFGTTIYENIRYIFWIVNN